MNVPLLPIAATHVADGDTLMWHGVLVTVEWTQHDTRRPVVRFGCDDGLHREAHSDALLALVGTDYSDTYPSL